MSLCVMTVMAGRQGEPILQEGKERVIGMVVRTDGIRKGCDGEMVWLVFGMETSFDG